MQTATRKSGLIGRADKILGSTATAFVSVTGLGVVGETQQAQAQIIYTPVNIAVPNNIDGIYLNVVTGAFGSSGAGVAGWDINPYSADNGASTTFFSLFGPDAQTYLSTSGVIAGPYPLALNTPIGLPLSNFFNPAGANNVGPQVTLNATNYFGFEFINEGNGNLSTFGWFSVAFGANPGTRTITGYAYELSGGTILAGAGVPEPTSLALLSVGAAGLASYRRFRRKAS